MKTKYKFVRRLTALLLILVMLSGLILTAWAASGTTVNVYKFGRVDFNYYNAAGNLVWSGGWMNGAYNRHYIDGKIAYCAEPNRAGPTGQTYSETGWGSLEASKRAAAAKALAYGAPNNGASDDASVIATQLVIWGIMTGYVDASGNAIKGRSNPFFDIVTDKDIKDAYNTLISDMGSHADLPEGIMTDDVEVYTTKVKYDDTHYYQELIRMETPGKLTLKKASADPAITSGNGCYSLAGAEYTVYSDKDCSKKVRTLTTKEDGTTDTLQNLALGKYYVVETKAPKGFALGDTVYTVSVTAYKTAVLEVTDFPQSDPVAVLLKKVDANSGEAVAAGDGTLADAEYTFAYYDGQFETAAAAQNSGRPARTWVYKTNKNGIINFLDMSLKVSGDDTYCASNGNPTLPLGTLLIWETKAPDGYNLDPTIYVRNITVDGTLENVQSYNTLVVAEQPIMGKLSIRKTTQTGLEHATVPEAGAEFQVYLKSAGSYAAASEDVRDTLTINGEGVATSKELPYGTYIVHQISGWDGRQIAPDFEVTISESKTYSKELNNEAFYAYLKIIKTDSITSNTIPAEGIGFRLYMPDGTLVEVDHQSTWYSDANGVVSLPVALEYGHGYKAVEVSAPDGYLLDGDPVFFDVTAATAEKADELTVITITVPNTPTAVQIDKVDAEGKAVVGAVLQVVDATGKIVDEWSSDGKGRTIRALTIGQTYTLHEVTAPIGKVVAADMTFTVEPTADVQLVTMTDKTVTVKKIDTQGCPVSGASLQIIDAMGTVIDEWTTDTNPHTAQNLIAGQTYTLHEAEAPDGWLLAPDVQFTVSTEGIDQTIEMIDGKVKVSKQDMNGKDLPGANLQIIDANGKIIDSWISDETPHAASNLAAGQTYTLHEAEAPGGWLLASDVQFTANSEGVIQTIVMQDEEVPELHTTATVRGSHMANATMDITMIDTVQYAKLVPGQEYTVTGKLMDQVTGEAMLDHGGVEITAGTTFTAEAAEGSVAVTFDFDASDLAGHSIVVFEELYREGKLYCIHADLEDEGQTVHFPEICTTATVRDRHTANAIKVITLIDTVSYKNLIPGREYIVTGKLMDTATGEVLLDREGGEITAYTAFTAEAAEGSADVVFTFNALYLGDHDVVAYEYLYENELLIASHAEPEDEDQTVHFNSVIGQIDMFDTVSFNSVKTGDRGIALYILICLLDCAAILLLLIQHHRTERRLQNETQNIHRRRGSADGVGTFRSHHGYGGRYRRDAGNNRSNLSFYRIRER